MFTETDDCDDWTGYFMDRFIDECANVFTHGQVITWIYFIYIDECANIC